MAQSVTERTRTEGDAGKEHYYNSLFYDLSKIITETTTSGFTKSSLLSYFSRLNYKFNERYLLTASMRADGSSTLAKGNKWGYFPSLAAAWRINEEPFLANSRDWLTNLKFRASWGKSGNAAVDPYSTLTSLSNRILYYYLDGKDIPGNIPSTMGNEELTWETTTVLDFGIDFGIIDNRISGSIDYFSSKTDDLLYLKSAPASSVFPSVLANIGKLRARDLKSPLTHWQ